MKRLSPAQGDLAGRYVPLARAIARRYARQYPIDTDGIFDAATDALCEAALHFDPGRGVKFSTYASLIISRRCVDHVRRRAKRRAVPIEMDMDQLPAHGPAPHRDVDESDSFEKILLRLPNQHAQLMRLLCQYDYSRSEAARLLRLGASRIQLLLYQARQIYDGK